MNLGRYALLSWKIIPRSRLSYGNFPGIFFIQVTLATQVISATLLTLAIYFAHIDCSSYIMVAGFRRGKDQITIPISTSLRK